MLLHHMVKILDAEESFELETSNLANIRLQLENVRRFYKIKNIYQFS